MQDIHVQRHKVVSEADPVWIFGVTINGRSFECTVTVDPTPADSTVSVSTGNAAPSVLSWTINSSAEVEAAALIGAFIVFIASYTTP